MNLRRTIQEWDLWLIGSFVICILFWSLLMFWLEVFAQTAPRLIIQWDPITDSRLAGYKIKRTVGALPYAVVGTVDKVTQWQDNNVDPFTTYQIIVVGVDINGVEGNPSIPVSGSFVALQPAQPTNFAASNASSSSPGRVAKTFTWTAVTKMRNQSTPVVGPSYLIYMATSDPATGASGSLVTTVTATTYTHQGMQKNRTYYFWVSCVVNGVESFGSPAVRVQT